MLFAARFRSFLLGLGLVMAVAGVAPTASAAAPEPSPDADTEDDEQPLSKRKDQKWINRWAPERNTWEVGLFAGVLLPSTRVELFRHDPNRPNFGFVPFSRAAFDLGLRGGYYPLRFLGIEAEAAVMPSQTAAGQQATFWALRGHVVGQLGLWSVTPFAVLGAGAFSVASPDTAAGNDVDASIHFGGGVKVFLTRYVMLRLDLRDIMSARRGVAQSVAHNGEFLLGVSFTLGRKKDRDRPPPPDEPLDSDGDGFMDDEDSCPQTPGIEPDGCPEGDADGDGFLDGDDACPEEPGVEPDGCPPPDTDGDGLADPDDACPKEPETVNRYQDDDGCPDKLPEKLKKFTGAIEGIAFELDSAKIRRRSRPVLDDVVSTLKEYPDLRLRISGHTDATGSREYNVALSKRRADAVKKYLTDAGIEGSRLKAVGRGPDDPVASNDTKEGRAQNRRIEFEILKRK